MLLKLWNWNRMSPDQLLAQGFLSFSELRNRPLLPRWSPRVAIWLLVIFFPQGSKAGYHRLLRCP